MNVVDLNAVKRPYGNIVEMLRLAADEIEKGIEPIPRYAMFVAVNSSDEPPVVYGWGADVSRYEQVGALASAQASMLRCELEPL